MSDSTTLAPMAVVRDSCENCGSDVGMFALYCDYCRFAGYSP